MYEICKEVHFSAAHIIEGHPGKCSELHGHNWRVRLQVTCETLDSIGMGVEFSHIKEVLREITDRLDHKDLNALPIFQTQNPTAENLARYIFQETGKRLNAPGRQVSRVQIWETDSSSVAYSE